MAARDDLEPIDIKRRWGYLLVAAGFLVAFAGSFEPLPTHSYQLRFGWFLWAIVPYVIYAPFIALRRPGLFLTAGVLILVVDIYSRLHALLFDSALPAAVVQWRPLWLTVIVLPVGLLAGMLFGGPLKEPKPEPAEAEPAEEPETESETGDETENTSDTER